jgi:flavin-binding protein dodecin
MSDHVYRMLELTGSSTESSDHAVRSAISKAAESTKHMDWFEVIETRGEIKKGDVAVWQVTLKIGYRLEH